MIPQTDKISLREIRDIGQTINASFTFIKQNLKPLIRSVAVIMLPFSALYAMSIFFTLISLSEIFDNGQSIIAQFVQSIASLLSMAAVTVATYSYIAIYEERKYLIPITTKEVWDRSKQLIIPYSFSLIGYIILIVVAFMFFFIPGIYLVIASITWSVAYVLDNTGFTKAISTSIRLSNSNWWRSFFFLFVLYIINFAISMTLIFPFYVLLLFLALFNAEGLPELFTHISEGKTLVAIFSLVFTVVLQLLYIIPLVAIGFYYRSLQEEKEGIGLYEQIKNINTPDEEDAPDLKLTNEEGY